MMRKSIFIAARRGVGAASNQWYDLDTDKGRSSVVLGTSESRERFLPRLTPVTEGDPASNDAVIYLPEEGVYGAFAVTSQYAVNGKSGIALFAYFDKSLSDKGLYAVDYSGYTLPEWTKKSDIDFQDLQWRLPEDWLPDVPPANDGFYGKEINILKDVIDCVLTDKRVALRCAPEFEKKAKNALILALKALPCRVANEVSFCFNATTKEAIKSVDLSYTVLSKEDLPLSESEDALVVFTYDGTKLSYYPLIILDKCHVSVSSSA